MTGNRKIFGFYFLIAAAAPFAAAADTESRAPLTPEKIILVDSDRSLTEEDSKALTGATTSQDCAIVKDGAGTLTISDANNLRVTAPFEVREGALVMNGGTITVSGKSPAIAVAGTNASMVLDNGATLNYVSDKDSDYQQSCAVVGGRDGNGSVTIQNGSSWDIQHSLFIGTYGLLAGCNPGTYKSAGSTEMYPPERVGSFPQGSVSVLSGSTLTVHQDIYIYDETSQMKVSGEKTQVTVKKYTNPWTGEIVDTTDYGGYLWVGVSGAGTLIADSGAQILAEEAVVVYGKDSELSASGTGTNVGGKAFYVYESTTLNVFDGAGAEAKTEIENEGQINLRGNDGSRRDRERFRRRKRRRDLRSE